MICHDCALLGAEQLLRHSIEVSTSQVTSDAEVVCRSQSSVQITQVVTSNACVLMFSMLSKQGSTYHCFTRQLDPRSKNSPNMPHTRRNDPSDLFHLITLAARATPLLPLSVPLPRVLALALVRNILKNFRANKARSKVALGQTLPTRRSKTLHADLELGQPSVQRGGHDSDAGEGAVQRCYCVPGDEEGEDGDVRFWGQPIPFSSGRFARLLLLCASLMNLPR